MAEAARVLVHHPSARLAMGGSARPRGRFGHRFESQGERQMRLHQTSLLVACLLLLAPGPASAELSPFADMEVGWTIPGYNDMQIPGETGTRFSLNSGPIRSASSPYFRLRLGTAFAERHTVYLTAAPLLLQARGTLASSVDFDGSTFPAGSFVTGQYRFDTWRLTYRYTWWRSEALEAMVGLTALVRDAGITLQGGNQFAERLNVGLVPLLSFSFHWRFAPDWSLLLDGDALASPFGRAEDVQLALRCQLRPGLAVRLGYRVVEGGSNGKSVYNFSWTNLVGVGLEVGPW